MTSTIQYYTIAFALGMLIYALNVGKIWSTYIFPLWVRCCFPIGALFLPLTPPTVFNYFSDKFIASQLSNTGYYHLPIIQYFSRVAIHFHQVCFQCTYSYTRKRNNFWDSAIFELVKIFSGYSGSWFMDSTQTKRVTIGLACFWCGWVVGT